MPEVELYLGATLQLQSTHEIEEKSHLCIILKNPFDVNRQVLYVPIITFRNKSDTTCTLEVGDHPFIKHKSCVHYDKVQQRAESQLLRRCNNKLQEPLSKEVLKRVLDGVLDSPNTPPWAKKLLGDCQDSHS